ncbi:DUF2163 domain-containing protein [Methylobrevis albus]|uniref:DUF2163 domain-containing protein n=1 Tax=Methylobrevis albus TaxID=2793297 RepID=A0A931HZH4_9HYPH|nr:DUF2163 domain-containing protein [Methylobrevis albus]MBH0237602.1 DUF2163 domain-containing protein [Methylobrevis albus]
MRSLPDDLAARLAAGATTLANCWLLTRADGSRFGFTDHDRDLVVDGVTCRAASGLDRSAAAASGDFAAGDEDLAGVVAGESLSEEDLAAGRWDGARVEVYLTDWTDPASALLLRAGTIGEVVRSDGAFRAELRGPAHALGHPVGRLFGRGCDAELGDARCAVALDHPDYRATADVVGGDGIARLLLQGLGAFDDDWFAGGLLVPASGALADRPLRIDLDRRAGDLREIVLWRRAPLALAPGLLVTLTAGCDKRFATCRTKFANTVNFRGFPHMPGNDFAFAYARSDGGNTGGVLF